MSWDYVRLLLPAYRQSELRTSGSACLGTQEICCPKWHFLSVQNHQFRSKFRPNFKFSSKFCSYIACCLMCKHRQFFYWFPKSKIKTCIERQSVFLFLMSACLRKKINLFIPDSFRPSLIQSNVKELDISSPKKSNPSTFWHFWRSFGHFSSKFRPKKLANVFRPNFVISFVFRQNAFLSSIAFDNTNFWQFW